MYTTPTELGELWWNREGMRIAGLHWSTCLVCLDDILIFSKTLEEYFDKLRDVLERLRRAGLKIKPEKCHIFRKEVQYLGHIVSKKGIATDP